MKKRNLKLFISALLLTTLFIGTQTNASAQSFDTTIIRSSNLVAGQNVNLKFTSTDLEVKTWAKNELQVKYSYEIEMKDPRDLAEFWSVLVKNIPTGTENEINLSSPFSE
jgi:hypothetical protein